MSSVQRLGCVTKWRSVLALAAMSSMPAMAAELEFEGVPSVKVEMVEGVTQSSPIPPQRARESAVRVIQTSTGYVWASRNNVPLTKTESGAYVTFTATTGAGYIRVLNSSMRQAIDSMPKDQREKEFLYMEHMINQLGSITYFGK